MDSSTKLKEQLNRIAILLLWTYESNNFILKAAVEEFERFKQSWGSIAIESVDYSFRKVIKKGSFPQVKMLSEKHYIYGLQNCIKNRMAEPFQTGHWLENNSLWMIRYKTVFSNMKTFRARLMSICGSSLLMGRICWRGGEESQR